MLVGEKLGGGGFRERGEDRGGGDLSSWKRGGREKRRRKKERGRDLYSHGEN